VSYLPGWNTRVLPNSTFLE